MSSTPVYNDVPPPITNLSCVAVQHQGGPRMSSFIIEAGAFLIVLLSGLVTLRIMESVHRLYRLYKHYAAKNSKIVNSPFKYVLLYHAWQ